MVAMWENGDREVSDHDGVEGTERQIFTLFTSGTLQEEASAGQGRRDAGCLCVPEVTSEQGSAMGGGRQRGKHS